MDKESEVLIKFWRSYASCAAIKDAVIDQGTIKITLYPGKLLPMYLAPEFEGYPVEWDLPKWGSKE